jgi:hypothetical protein
VSLADDIYAQRIHERNELRDKRREAERQLHDEYMAGTPRSMRASQFANQVLALLDKFIPEACRREAHDELVLNAFQMDVEIVPVPPERDAQAAAELKRVSITLPQYIIPKTE